MASNYTLKSWISVKWQAIICMKVGDLVSYPPSPERLGQIRGPNPVYGTVTAIHDGTNSWRRPARGICRVLWVGQAIRDGAKELDMLIQDLVIVK